MDFEVIKQGSIIQIVAKSEAATDWINENVDAPPYMWNGVVLNVEHRYADQIVGGMLEAGLEGEAA